MKSPGPQFPIHVSYRRGGSPKAPSREQFAAHKAEEEGGGGGGSRRDSERDRSLVVLRNPSRSTAVQIGSSDNGAQEPGRGELR